MVWCRCLKDLPRADGHQRTSSTRRAPRVRPARHLRVGKRRSGHRDSGRAMVDRGPVAGRRIGSAVRGDRDSGHPGIGIESGWCGAAVLKTSRAPTVTSGPVRPGERRAFDRPATFASVSAVLAIATLAARWWTVARSQAEESEVQFEETLTPAILVLGLNRDGVVPLS